MLATVLRGPLASHLLSTFCYIQLYISCSTLGLSFNLGLVYDARIHVNLSSGPFQQDKSLTRANHTSEHDQLLVGPAHVHCQKAWKRAITESVL